MVTLGIMATLAGILRFFFTIEELVQFFPKFFSKNISRCILIIALFLVSHGIASVYSHYNKSYTATNTQVVDDKKDIQPHMEKNTKNNVNIEKHKDNDEVPINEFENKFSDEKFAILMKNANGISSSISRDNMYNKILDFLLENKKYDKLHGVISLMSSSMSQNNCYLKSINHIIENKGDIHIATKLADAISSSTSKSNAYNLINEHVMNHKK